jgi:immunity protein Imm1 of predicted polymorphic toxin system
MPATLTWGYGNEVALDHHNVASALARATEDAGEGSDIATAASGDAQMTIVVGDPTGTSLWYFSGDSANSAGFLSVGDRSATDANASDPPLVVDWFGNHTEFPRWSVVPHPLAERALLDFIEDPTEPPRSVSWESL